MKKILLLILGLFFTYCNIYSQAQYNLSYNESEFLSLPDPPYDGYIASALWNVNNDNLTFAERSEAGAIIYPNHYFEGSSVVTCNYRYEYYRNDRMQTGTGVASYVITFNSNHATLSKSEVTIMTGKTEKLTYKLERSYGSAYGSPKMTWESNREEVATVDKNGKVTAISPGTATITFDPVVGPPVYCYVTVVSNPPTAVSLPATATTKVGEAVTLTPTLTPSDAYTTFTWKSSDENVATVSVGKVTGKNVGKTTITATTDNGLSARCEVTVEKGSVTISADTESGIYASGKEIVLKANRTDADIYYTLDGSTPSTSSTRYNEPITLTKSVTLKAIATGKNYETSDVLTRQYQITSLTVKSSWDENVEQTPFFIPVITFSKSVKKSTNFGSVKLSNGTTDVSGQPIVQDGKLFFIPDSKLDSGTYTLTIPENAVMDANGEPNLATQQKLTIGQGFGAMPKLVSGGLYKVLIIMEDGTLWGCGYNGWGQLGDGSTTKRLTPVKVMDDVVSASAGSCHSLIVKKDASLWACGRNEDGELGDGTTTNSVIPVKIMSDVACASAGDQRSFIVKKDGSLWACGNNKYGQLGDGTKTNRITPVKIMDNVATVSTGMESLTLIIKTDGSLWKVDYGSTNTIPIKIADGVVSVSAGRWHYLIIKDDGSLWACGDNNHGQLGDGTTTNRIEPVKIMDNVVLASAGAFHSLFIKTDGSLWGCGENSKGELGDGIPTYRNQLTPMKIMDDVTFVSAAGQIWGFSHIIKKDGSLWACGYNSYGQLGDGTTTDKSTPVCIIPVSSFKHVTSISLPQTTLQMALGSQYLILPTMAPEHSCPETLEFSSSNPQVASVSARGIVEAKAAGTTTITVIADGKYTAKCEVEVKTTDPTSISLPSEITIDVCTIEYLSAEITPSDAETTLIWSSDDSSIAMVDKKGFVLGNKAGKTVIRVKTSNGLSASCRVTVEETQEYTSLGTGSFSDNRFFEEKVETKVEILQNKHYPTQFRIVRPYDGIVNDEGEKYEGSEYLELDIYGDNLVDYYPINMGYYIQEYDSEVWLWHPSYFTSMAEISFWQYNKVLSYQENGLPDKIQLAPLYYMAMVGGWNVSQEDDVIVITFPKVQKKDYMVQFSDDGYATFYSSQSAYKLPNGVSASVITNVGNNKLTYKTIAKGTNSELIPKGEAVLLKNDAQRAGTYTLTASDSNTSYSGTNLLRGCDEATTVSPGDNEYAYKLSYGPDGTQWSNVFGWYWGAENGGAFSIEGHKAWLIVPKGSTRAAGFTLEGDATAIIDIHESANDNNYFDLQGRRIDHPSRKGLYIMNGKKVLVH